MRSFTELRQQCCHPQIVRRDMWLGKTRLSMRQILTRLVLRAFTDYDIALRQEYVARLLLAAVLISDQHEGVPPGQCFCLSCTSIIKHTATDTLL